MTPSHEIPSTTVSRWTFHTLWIAPIALLAAVTVAFRSFPWDLEISSMAFDAVTQTFQGNSIAWVRFCYKHAAWPAFAIAMVSLFLLSSSFGWPKAKRWRRVCGYFLIAGIVGPGLIVNTTLKDHWGRPRPVQVSEFGGTEAFLPVGAPGANPDCRSFPSGHASIAFFIIAPFFVLLPRRRGPALFALALGLAWGIAVGVARIEQGGHWTSDVIWAGGIVFLTCFATARAFGLLRAGSIPIQAENE